MSPAINGKGIVECVTVRQVARTEAGLEHEAEITIHMKERSGQSMSNNDCHWVREHGTRHGPAPLWHYYPEVYGAAACGHPSIPGMPMVATNVDGLFQQESICKECFEQIVVTSVMDCEGAG